jgi:hypothetical protein
VRIHVIPADTGPAWGLTAQRFRQALARHRPDVPCGIEHDDAGAGTRAGFEVDFGEWTAEGLYYAGSVDGLTRPGDRGGRSDLQQLVCWDAGIEKWAPLIEWFLGLLPEDAAVEAFLDAAAVPRHLPRSATAADIARILTELDQSAG